MRQPTPTLPVTTKMLRHFAVVTVAITACIGIFAQGENAEVAAGPKQAAAAPAESGGGFLDFGGAERAALTGANKGPQEVNGMKLASGTRLNSGGDDGGGGGGSDGSGPGEATGSVQYTPPLMRPGQSGPAFQAGAAPQGNELAPRAAPPPIPKDANGVPAPGAAVAASKIIQAAKPQPPRKATQQDIDRMMAASSQRSGGANTN